MMSAMKLIAQASFSDGAAEVFFTNIPQTYKHLYLSCITKGNTNGTGRINAGYLVNSQTTGYYSTQLKQISSATYNYMDVSNYTNATMFRVVSQILDSNNSTAGNFAEMWFPNYTDSTYQQRWLVRHGIDIDALASAGHSNSFSIMGHSNSSTGAITSIQLYDAGGVNIDSDSCFYLYGIEG